ncbi:glucose-6-phosphate dehydrogenase [Nocardioides convexus]|uniref:glucose-6-phosphate dehydrogenase n=1 Tax=Nocardioides convexus TaxID=2712224 RepID=UPI002418996F|nr:glucose-6-phosphate dehydrogenase [Nocardioides convexus]
MAPATSPSAKLLPGLYERERQHQLHPDTRIVGVSRHALDDAGYRDLVTTAIFDHVPEDHLEAGAVHRLISRLHHLALDAHDPEGWDLLHGLLKEEAATGSTTRTRVFYLAVSSDLFGPLCQRLDDLGLVDTESRVVLEKPIGADLASSRAVNDAVGRVFEERQIFRIDHYLGKESVQNLLVTRFANIFLEPIWDSRWVDHVQITVSETLGAAGRGDYYDRAGAMRDMVQNHLLQMLCLVAMEPPTYVGGDPVRDEKLKVLRALKPLTGAEADRSTVRGQYTTYGEEIGHPSTTETFVALRAEVQNWRWAGVPFYLRTGKRLARKESKIEVVFKEPPHAMFPHSEGVTTPNRLTIRMQPDEGMQLHVTAKHPGPGGIRLHPASLDLSLRRRLRRAQPGRLRAAAPRRHARHPDPVHAPRRGRGRVGVDRADHRAVAALGARAGPLPPRNRRSRRGSDAAGARGPHLAGVSMTHPVLADVTRRLTERSAATRTAYLARVRAAAGRGPARGRLACANLAHGFAAADEPAKAEPGARAEAQPGDRHQPTTTCSPPTSRTAPTRPCSRTR